MGPFGQLDVVYKLRITMSSTKVNMVRVQVKFWEVKELWNYLTNICVVSQSVQERLLERVENSVRIIMVHAL